MRLGSIHSAGQAIADVVLSMGHASMLLYSLLHLPKSEPSTKTTKLSAKYPCHSTPSKLFGQLDSRCPGHPGYRWTSGGETTTGLLGQGGAPTSVGMATPSNGWQRDTTVQASKICSTSTSTRFAEMDA